MPLWTNWTLDRWSVNKALAWVLNPIKCITPFAVVSQYQAMLAADGGLQNQGNATDLLRQQMMSFQQPFNYLQQSENLSPLQLPQQQTI